MRGLAIVALLFLSLGAGALSRGAATPLAGRAAEAMVGGQIIFPNSRCLIGAVTCNEYQGMAGGPLILPCPQPNVCSYCDPPGDDLKSCVGGFAGWVCDLDPQGAQDCGYFKLGTCSGGVCQNGAAVSSCVDADWSCWESN